MFYRDNLEELKIEIFKNLDNYPFDSIKPLIDLGLSYKNKIISSLIEKLLREHNASMQKCEACND